MVTAAEALTLMISFGLLVVAVLSFHEKR
ncbi:putative holin-like toxin [Evansella clarkii]